MEHNDYILFWLEKLKKEQKDDHDQSEKYKNLSKEIDVRMAKRAKLIEMIESPRVEL